MKEKSLPPKTILSASNGWPTSPSKSKWFRKRVNVLKKIKKKKKLY